MRLPILIPAAASRRPANIMAKRKRDYYTVLGVARDASEPDLKRAFRELARQHHPDVNPADGGERFREINETAGATPTTAAAASARSSTRRRT